MLYLTPTRYRSIQTGVDLSGKTDTAISIALQAASDTVNAAVGAPDGYSFLGGDVVDEEHIWREPDRAPKQNFGRIWPYMRPLIDVDEMRVNVTRTQYITFEEDQLFVQNALGYVESVAAPNTTALFTSVPPWLLTAPIAYVTYSYGYHLIATDERLATASEGDLQAAHQFWFTDEEIALKKNGTLLTVTTDYTYDAEEGFFTPLDPFTEDDIFKATYHYKLPPGIAAATALIATDMFGQQAIAAAGMLGLSGFKVEEVEVRQSSKVNYAVTPVNMAAQVFLGRYKALFTSMR